MKTHKIILNNRCNIDNELVALNNFILAATLTEEQKRFIYEQASNCIAEYKKLSVINNNYSFTREIELNGYKVIIKAGNTKLNIIERLLNLVKGR